MRTPKNFGEYLKTARNTKNQKETPKTYENMEHPKITENTWTKLQSTIHMICFMKHFISCLRQNKLGWTVHENSACFRYSTHLQPYHLWGQVPIQPVWWFEASELGGMWTIQFRLNSTALLIEKCLLDFTCKTFSWYSCQHES